VPFRATFDCLWCGRAWVADGALDLTGWAGLCGDCLERAAENQFLRFRLRAALRERSAGGLTPASGGYVGTGAHAALAADTERGTGEAPATRLTESDDRYLRRGRYSRGPARDLAWHLELDQATTWLDRLPLSGQIVELAAGTGWWSPLLANKGELSLYDVSAASLELARERLVAHRLRAHLHVRDAWAEPDRQVDTVFCGFWLGHVHEERLGDFLALVHRWLRPGGSFAFIDARSDPEAGAADLDDLAPGPVAYREASELAAALAAAGFGEVRLEATARFFQMGVGTTVVDSRT
jgi:SAM-dependent methyltransferase